jgi:hypothetical protein
MIYNDINPWFNSYVLDLNDTINALDCGHWAKFKFTAVARTEKRPHGLKYALTLHRLEGHRVIGYDNAHIPENLKNQRAPAGKVTIPLDHSHWRDQEAQFYNFENPGKLLEDFWGDVYRYLKEEGIA